jgi:hypothetical protein
MLNHETVNFSVWLCSQPYDDYVLAKTYKLFLFAFIFLCLNCYVEIEYILLLVIQRHKGGELP